MYEQGYLLVHPVERPLIEIWDNFIKNHRYLMQGDPAGQRKMLASDRPRVFDGILVDIEREGDNDYYEPSQARSKSCTMTLCDAVNQKLKWHMHFDFTFDLLQDCAISKSNRLLAIVRKRPVNEGKQLFCTSTTCIVGLLIQTLIHQRWNSQEKTSAWLLQYMATTSEFLQVLI